MQQQIKVFLLFIALQVLKKHSKTRQSYSKIIDYFRKLMDISALSAFHFSLNPNSTPLSTHLEKQIPWLPITQCMTSPHSKCT